MDLEPYLGKVKKFEGFSNKPYWDYKQWTSGYGTKGRPGELVDQATADQRLRSEFGSAFQNVNSFAPNAPDGVKAALSSLTFNAGPKWMGSGLGGLVKAGDWSGAKNRFLQYNKAGGMFNPGLASRRQQEASWFDGTAVTPEQGADVAPRGMAGGIAKISPEWARDRMAVGAPPPQAGPTAYSTGDEDAMLKELAGQTIQPFRSGWAGVAGIGNSIMGGMAMRQLRQNAQAKQTGEQQSLQAMAGGGMANPQALMTAAAGAPPGGMAQKFGLERALKLQDEERARNSPEAQAALQLKQAQIEKMHREAQSGGEAPSNVREWQHFNSLSPEDQQRYLNMKRTEKYLDIGTGFVRPNPADPNASPALAVNKDLAGAERDKAVGEAQGKALAAAPKDVSIADDALSLIQSIRGDKNLDAGTAVMSPLMNLVPKTPGYDFQNKVNQAKSGAFLTAIQQMRGLGALSNAEGQTATEAVNRINTATTKEEFLSALSDYERVIVRGRETAMRLLSNGRGASQPQPGATAAPTDYKSRYGLD